MAKASLMITRSEPLFSSPASNGVVPKEDVPDHCFFSLGRARSEEQMSKKRNGIMVPHPKLGWITGVSRGFLEVKEDAVRRLHYLVELRGAGFGILGDAQEIPSSQLFEIDHKMLRQIQKAYPLLKTCKSVPQLCNILPPIPKSIDTTRQEYIKPLDITDFASVDFSLPAFGFGFGLPNATPFRRFYAQRAALCHVIRERAIAGIRCTHISPNFLIRVAPSPYDKDQDAWDSFEESKLHRAVENVVCAFQNAPSASLCSSTEVDADDQACRCTSHSLENNAQPHLLRFMEVILKKLLSDAPEQVVLFQGVSGSGKTFCLRKSVDFVLSVNAKIRDARRCPRPSEAAPHTHDPDIRTLVDAALIVLDAFGNVNVSSENVEDSNRLASILKFHYRNNVHNALEIRSRQKLKVSGATVFLSGVEISSFYLLSNCLFAPDLENSFRILSWLCREDDIAQQRVRGVEAALHVLGFSDEELSSVTSVLASVLVLRTPDLLFPVNGNAATFGTAQQTTSQHSTLLSFNRASTFSVSGSHDDKILLHMLAPAPLRGSALSYKSEDEALEMCSHFLGIDVEKLKSSLRYEPTHNFTEKADPKGAGSEILAPAYTTGASAYKRVIRGCLAKYIYTFLVHWLIERINMVLKVPFLPCVSASCELHNELSNELTDTFVDGSSVAISSDCGGLCAVNSSATLTFIDNPGFDATPCRTTAFEALISNTFHAITGHAILQRLGLDNLEDAQKDQDLLGPQIRRSDPTLVADCVLGTPTRIGFLTKLEAMFAMKGPDIIDNNFADLHVALNEVLIMNSFMTGQARGFGGSTSFVSTYSQPLLQTEGSLTRLASLRDVTPERRAPIRLGAKDSSGGASSSITITHPIGNVTYDWSEWLINCPLIPPRRTRLLLSSCHPIFNAMFCRNDEREVHTSQFETMRSWSDRVTTCGENVTFDNSDMCFTDTRMKSIRTLLMNWRNSLEIGLQSAEISAVLCVVPHSPRSDVVPFYGPWVNQQLDNLELSSLCTLLGSDYQRSMSTADFVTRYRCLTLTALPVCQLQPYGNQGSCKGLCKSVDSLKNDDNDGEEAAKSLIRVLQCYFNNAAFQELKIKANRVFARSTVFGELDELLLQRRNSACDERSVADTLKTQNSRRRGLHSPASTCTKSDAAVDERWHRRQAQAPREVLLQCASADSGSGHSRFSYSEKARSVKQSSTPQNLQTKAAESLQILRTFEDLGTQRFVRLDYLEPLLRQAQTFRLSNLLIAYFNHLYDVEKELDFPTNFVENTEESLATFLHEWRNNTRDSRSEGKTYSKQLEVSSCENAMMCPQSTSANSFSTPKKPASDISPFSRSCSSSSSEFLSSVRLQTPWNEDTSPKGNDDACPSAFSHTSATEKVSLLATCHLPEVLDSNYEQPHKPSFSTVEIAPSLSSMKDSQSLWKSPRSSTAESIPDESDDNGLFGYSWDTCGSFTLLGCHDCSSYPPTDEMCLPTSRSNPTAQTSGTAHSTHNAHDSSSLSPPEASTLSSCVPPLLTVFETHVRRSSVEGERSQNVESRVTPPRDESGSRHKASGRLSRSKHSESSVHGNAPLNTTCSIALDATDNTTPKPSGSCLRRAIARFQNQQSTSLTSVRRSRRYRVLESPFYTADHL